MRLAAASALVALCLIAGGSAYRILCLLPYPGKSHHMVFEPLLQELTRRGHDLTVVSFFPPEKPAPNRRDVSLLGITQPYAEVVDLKSFEVNFYGLERYVEHAPLVMGLARSNLKLCEQLLDFPAFKEFVDATGEYDLIIVEHFNSDCMMGLIHKYGVPSVGLMSSAVLPWTAERLGFPDNPSHVPGMTLRVTDRMTFLERMENAFFLYFYKLWFRWEIRPREQVLLERKLGPLPPLEEVAKRTSVVLVNTHHSLNGVKALVPAVVEVGGLHLHGRSPQKLPSNLEEFISRSANGFILISFGSLIRSSTMPPHRLQPFLRVLSRLPQRVLWKWESEHIDALPDNVLVMKWLPQYDLLPNLLLLRDSEDTSTVFESGASCYLSPELHGVRLTWRAAQRDGGGGGGRARAAGVGVGRPVQQRDTCADCGALRTAALHIDHPSCVAFVSHGGLLSVTEATEAGVPMLLVPVLGDQFGNAAHARTAGLAVLLHYTDINERTLEQALKEVLKPQMRVSAQQLSRAWQDRPEPPLLTAAYFVERTARLGNATNMAGASRNIPAYQLMLLDVVAVAILLLMIVAAVMYYAVAKALAIIIRCTTCYKIKLS